MPVLPSLYITLDLSFPPGLQLKGALQMLFPLAEVPALAQPHLAKLSEACRERTSRVTGMLSLVHLKNACQILKPSFFPP